MARQRLQQYLCSLSTPLFSSFTDFLNHFRKSITKEDKTHLYALFAIVLLAIVVRLFFLFQPMRHDESLTFMLYASKPLPIGLSFYSRPNNHLFHTLLAHIAYLCFGNQPWAIRLPALFAGVLLVPASYLAIRTFYNKYAALLAAGLVASSSTLIGFSTNARGYTLIWLIFLLILTIGKYLKQNNNLFAWFLFVILSVIGFYTIPVMLYPFGVVITWLFLSAVFKDTDLSQGLLIRNLFISLISVAILTFILYIPVFVASGFKAVFCNPYVSPSSWSNFISDLPSSPLEAWQQWNRDIPRVLSFFLVIGFLTSLVARKRLSCDRIPIVLAVIIWCIPLPFIHRVVPYPRIWTFLLPLYMGSASTGLIYLFRFIKAKTANAKSTAFSALSVLLAFWLSFNIIYSRSVCYFQDTGAFRPAEKTALFLRGSLRPRDKVLAACPGNAPLLYYFGLHHVPLKYFYMNLKNSNNIFVVVNGNKHTVKFLSDNIPPYGYSVPELVWQYQSAKVYKITRIN